MVLKNVSLQLDARVITFFIRSRKGNLRFLFTREEIEEYFRGVEMNPFNFDGYLEPIQDPQNPETHSNYAWIRQDKETGLYCLTESLCSIICNDV